MSLDNFNTKFSEGEFEDEPTSVLQQLGDAPFTVIKVKAGVSKSSNPYCIVWTDKTYKAGVNIAGENEEAVYEQQDVKKFFVTVREPKLFFSDPENVAKINGGDPCGPIVMTKIKFTSDEIAQNKKLAGKSHYILKSA